MERPKAEINTPSDEYDYEVEPVSADMIALTDALLEHKQAGSSLTFVDIVVPLAPKKVLERLGSIRAGTVLAGEDEQLAIQSDGSYYPQLDVRKKNGVLDSVSVRAWGWNDTKYRYTDLDKEELTLPREFKEYEGEIDKTRQLDISLYYVINGATVTESITMYGSSTEPNMPRIGREVWMSEYAETGYEGHGGKALENATEAEVYELLDLVAEIVGDKPESYYEHQLKQLSALQTELTLQDEDKMIDALLKNSYPALALYELLRPRDNLQGSSIKEAFLNPDTLHEGKAELQQLIDEYGATR